MYLYKYKYNGKELQDEFNLNMYDLGARGHDPARVQFGGIDPRAEDYYSQSPYVFASNNPVFYVDVNGEGVIENDARFGITSTVVNDDGEIIDYKDDGDDNIYLNTRSKENIIGKERENKLYFVGNYLDREDLNEGAELPNSFLINNPNPEKELIFWPVELIDGLGAWKNITHLGYFARLKLLFNGSTLKVTVSILANVKNEANMIKLLKSTEFAAKSQGVKKLVIEGVEILNTKLLNTRVFERLGYTVEKVTETTIKISKKF